MFNTFPTSRPISKQPFLKSALFTVIIFSSCTGTLVPTSSTSLCSQEKCVQNPVNVTKANNKNNIHFPELDFITSTWYH